MTNEEQRNYRNAIYPMIEALDREKESLAKKARQATERPSELRHHTYNRQRCHDAQQALKQALEAICNVTTDEFEEV